MASTQRSPQHCRRLVVNGDTLHKKCLDTVALVSIGVNRRYGKTLPGLGVNFLNHVNNPVCFAIILETESTKIYAE